MVWGQMNHRLKKVTPSRDAILNCLIKLALPAGEQVKVIKNENFVQELVFDYKDTVQEWNDSENAIASDLDKISIDIRIIDHFLRRFSTQKDGSHYWSFDALESHDDWDKVRKMARQALEKININMNQNGMSWTRN